MNKKILLVGGFIEIIELCEENKISIVGIVDNLKSKEYMSIPIIGSEENVLDWLQEFQQCEIIITPDSPDLRKKLSEFYERHGFKFSSIISSNARLSKSASIGKGSIIQAGVNISSEVVIGSFVKINTNANVMHNVNVGNYATIAPNAVLLGHVNIGESSYIGANATILPHVTISANVTVGAGAVVTKDIDIPFSTYVGVPAYQLRK